MEEQILKKLEEQQKQIEAMYKSVEAVRKYLMWGFIVTVVVVLLPLLVLPLVLPAALSGLTGSGLDF